MVHWSFCVICFAAGCLGAGFMFRKRFLEQVEILRKYELTVAGLFYSIHHDGFNPHLKRIRGCINVCKQLLQQMRSCRDKIESLEDFATRPNHFRYVTLLVAEVKTLLKQHNESQEWLDKISNECLSMENDIIENAKKYEQ